MTSPTGEVQLSQRFTPFGEVKEKYGDGEAAFGYTAQKYDAQTGLLYLRAWLPCARCWAVYFV